MRKSIITQLKISIKIGGIALACLPLLSAVIASAESQSLVHAKSDSFVQLPLVPCWFNGKHVLYIQTEASDSSVAQAQDVNLVTNLSSAANSSVVDDIYVFSNFQQPNVIASAPKPVGPKNTDPDYRPLWQVSSVTWNTGVSPHELTSEADIKAAASNGQLTISRTDIIVNCPVIQADGAGTLPNARIFGERNDQQVILPLINCWYNGAQILYIQTDASDATVAKAQGVNYVPGLAGAANTGVVDDIYVVTNFKQYNVIPSEPYPIGPENTDPDYTPLWQVSNVAWNQGVPPRVLTSEADIRTAASNGELTINKTDVVLNCPVLGSKLSTTKIFSP